MTLRHPCFALALLAVSALLALAACGGGGGDAGADPAAFVPERAGLYVEADVSEDEDVRALSQKLFGKEDPGAAIAQALNREARQEGERDFSFEEDIDPWLGDRIGAFATRVEAGSADSADGDGALVVAAEDVDRGRKYLERELREPDDEGTRPQVVERTYKGTTYQYDTTEEEGVAAVGDVLVYGTEDGIKGAIDAEEGSALADAEGFRRAREQADGEQGLLYARPRQLLSGLGPQGAVLQPLLAGAGEETAVGLDATADGIELESVTTGVRQPSTGPGRVLPTLPANAWLAGGTGDLGGQIERSLQQFGQLGAFGGFDLEQALGQIRRQTGLDVRRDLLSWMGDAGVFVGGTGVAEIGGGLVVRSQDPDTTRRAIPRIARLLSAQGELRVRPLSRPGVDAGVTLRSPEIPLPVHLALAGDRFVVAVGDPALAGAIRPAQRLAASPAFRQAAGRLGGEVEPAFFLDFDAVRQLVDQSGAAARGGEEGQQARRALEALTTLVVGSRREGDTQRGRVVIGVR